MNNDVSRGGFGVLPPPVGRAARRSGVLRLLGGGALAAAFAATLLVAAPARAACEPGPNQVSFFGDAGFHGSCVVKEFGDYANAGAIGLPNDSISSTMVGSNAQAMLCKDNDFKGDCILVTGSVSFINGNRVGNDQISSIKVQPLGFAACNPGPNQVSLYTNADFLGLCVVKDIGDYANAGAIGLPNDSISSVRVGANAQVVLCKDNDFNGDCIELQQSVSFLNGDRVGNDQTSSLRVQARGTSECVPGRHQASFFTNADFLGQCVVRNIGNYASSGAIGLPNDSISAVRIGADTQVVVCKDNDFAGDCILLQQSTAFLNDNRVGNDAVSSLKVQALGTPPECPPGNNQASFYTDAGFLGQCVVKNIGDYPNATAIGLPDRSISAVKLGAGVQACLCGVANFHGCTTVTADTSFLGQQNDLATAARVQAKGATCEAAAQPFVSAGVEAPAGGLRILRIRGNGFTPAEIVSLQITIKVGTGNPSTDVRTTAADATGAIDFQFSGAGGGVCGPTQTTFQVQGTGLSSGLKSNVAVTFC